MPNHVANVITLEGKADAIDAVKALLINASGELDFNLLIPMPERLRETPAVFSFWHGVFDAQLKLGDEAALNKIEAAAKDWEWLRSALKDASDPLAYARSLPEYQQWEAQRKNVEDFGYANWYDWANAEWGTKWNAYDASYLHTGKKLTLHFDTAWSPPEPWYEALLAAAQPLGVRVRGWCHDEGWNFWGSYGPDGVATHDCDRSAAHEACYEACYGEPIPPDEDECEDEEN